jgi:hypothetical protein
VVDGSWGKTSIPTYHLLHTTHHILFTGHDLQGQNGTEPPQDTITHTLLPFTSQATALGVRRCQKSLEKRKRAIQNSEFTIASAPIPPEGR